MRSASDSRFSSRRDDQPNSDAVLAVIDLLAQRWVLRIVWELEPGPLGFLELRRHMGNCSSSVLSERLNQLLVTQLVIKNDSGAWELTDDGRQLGKALAGLWDWSGPWHARLR